MSKLQTRNAFSNTSLQDSDLFWIETDLGGGTFESQKITGLQLKTILSQDPIVNDVVFIDQNTPTTVGVTFNPNTPLTQDILYLSTTNGSTWIYNGTTYVTYTMPVTSTTPFNLFGSSVDAGGNKTSAIQRSGDVYVGTTALNSIVSSTTGISHTANGFSQVFETSYSNTEYPIIRQTRRRGTQASSTPAQSGDILGTYSFNSNGDSASITVKATETHALTTRGSEIILSNCANGSASQVENLKIQQDGKVKISNAYTLPTTAPTSGQVLGYVSSGVSGWVTSAGGLTYFTEARSTTAPNTATNVDSLSAGTGLSTTNVDIAIVPRGTGAFQLAIPDNTTTGGNKRGQYAVDLQLIRNTNTQVASGLYSLILGGVNNTSSSTGSSVLCGAGNTSSNTYSISGGISNISSGAYSLSLGRSNTSSGDSSVSLGYICSSIGTASFTAGQSNTASGNSSIAMGASNTASSTSSVAMGQSSIASGAYSTAIGLQNTASNTYNIAIGYANNASGSQATAIGSANASNASNSVSIGTSNTASGSYSFAIGQQANTLSQYGRIAFSSGAISSSGDIQKSFYILKGISSSASAKTLTLDNVSASIVLQNNNVFRFKGSIIGKQSGSTNVAAWDVDGLIVRGANAAATTLAISNVTLVQNTPAWGTPTLTADTTNGGLTVNVIGASATNIQWIADIQTSEVIY